MVLLLSLTHVIAQTNKEYKIPFKKNAANVIELDVKINSFSRRFVFDTGASTVSFGNDFYKVLRSNSVFTDADELSRTKVKMANGSLVSAIIINIKKLEIGDIVLTDVKATVIEQSGVPFLLGQSVLENFGTITIDNNKNEIIVKSVGKPKKKGVEINEIRFIPCAFNSVPEVAKMKKIFTNDNQLTIVKITEEKNVPPPPAALKRISKNVTIRFFDNNDQNKVAAIYDKLITEGYVQNNIQIENMLPYYKNPIPGYIEIWIK